MACIELLQKIDELNDRYLDILEEMCTLESPTADKARVDAVSDYIVRWAEERGFDVERMPMEGAGDPLCITMNPAADKAPVALSGHIDTVHPVGLFPTPPVRRDEQFMYGPGVVDCKGGVAASMLAMEALQACGFTARPVKLIIQTDEETSSITSGKRTIQFMLDRARDAAAFLNTESCVDHQIVLSRKGIARFRFHVHGKAAHSAVCHKGASAIAEAAHKILRLEQLKDAKNLTCNCGVIQGGTVANTVPEDCTFVADFRFATAEQYEELTALVKDVAERTTVEGCTCHVETVSERPAMELNDTNIALWNRFNEIFTAAGVTPVIRRRSPGGSDAAYTTAAGIPTVDSIGVDGECIHSIDEHMKLESLALSAKRQALVVWEL